MGNITQSKIYYEKAISAKNYGYYLPHKHSINYYKGYGSILIFNDKSSLAVPFFQNALQDYPDSSDLWYFMALAYYIQHNKQAALEAAIKAYNLNPADYIVYIYTRIHNNEPIIINHYGEIFTFNP